jgi:hypothetical protein
VTVLTTLPWQSVTVTLTFQTPSSPLLSFAGNTQAAAKPSVTIVQIRKILLFISIPF